MKRLNEIMILICLMVITCFFSAAKANSELVESIVAVVNDDVILLSEFKAVMRQAKVKALFLYLKRIIPTPRFQAAAARWI